MFRFYRVLSILLLVIASGCGSFINQPLDTQDARFGEITQNTRSIRDLPKPESKIVVGVYNFKDQTGQYKPSQTTSSFSTAVTQGATTILLKALEDSEWFKPIERENLSNLLQERKIISATRAEYATDKNTVQKLTPLLFAGIILEGGVISYDSNILTGGAGARYFGAGGSTQYRQDRITIYLRAVSTSTGEILKNVYVSKTILSQALEAGLFRFVNFQRLLEAEVGLTKNEPTELAVKEAIEMAVENLIYEGIKDDLWSTQEGEEVDAMLVANYLEQQRGEEHLELYQKSQKENVKISASFFAGLAYIDGDLASREVDFNVGAGLKYHFDNQWRAQVDANLFRLYSSPNIDHWWVSGDINMEYRILEKGKFSPYIFAGPGALMFTDDSPTAFLEPRDLFFKLQYGLGFEYQSSQNFNWFAKAKFNLTFSDEIDDTINGTRDDYLYNFTLGVNYNIGF